jgi:hypothetical protein
MNKSLMLVCEVFSQSEPVHEDMFGDEYEAICISREMIDMKIAELTGNKHVEQPERTNVKKYHVFVGRIYYPKGADNYIASFETVEEATKHGESFLDEYGWMQIAESQEDGSLDIWKKKYFDN